MLNPAVIARRLEVLAIWSGRLLPWLMVPLIALTFGIVVLRYGFDFGSIAVQEGVTYLHALIMMLCMGYTLSKNEHVRVDILYHNMSRRQRAWVDFLGGLLFLMPTSLTILIVSWNYAAQSWVLLEGSPESGGLPLVFILKTLIPLMALLVLAQGIADVLRNYTVIKGEQS